MKKKSGITMVSIILYVTLFFIFTIFAISMGTNMNIKALSEKGEIYINEQFDKLQYNLLKSAKSSYAIDNMFGDIVFSNNDIYSYDSNKKAIKKNDIILVKGVEDLNIIDISNIDEIKKEKVENISSSSKNILIEIKFKKYDNEKIEQIFLTVGE